MSNITPIKRLSQNFLQDQNVVKKFVEIFSPLDGKNILEIGPGKGAITRNLFNMGAELSLIDIDERVLEPLRNQYTGINIIHGDFLKLDLENIAHSQKLTVVGNIPFKITSPIIFRLIRNSSLINEAVFIVQHEVAKRIIAQAGEKDYGILSVILGCTTSTNYCFRISSNVFYPKPKVDSAAIHIKFNKTVDTDLSHFINTVKAAFGNRRKTLKNSLSNSIFRDSDLSEVTIDLSRRAETLSVTEFVELAENLRKSNHNEQ